MMQVTDEVRRQRLFEGRLFVSRLVRRHLRLLSFARTLIRRRLLLTIQKAQYHMSVEAYAEILGER